jgi:hypothetical protein
VYQDLNIPLKSSETSERHNFARNIFRLDWWFGGPTTSNPFLFGELLANPYVYDKNDENGDDGDQKNQSPSMPTSTTIAIAFEKVGSKLMPFGWTVGPRIEFPKNKEVRLWEHVYVDGQYRIFYARNADDSSNEAGRGYLYICRRCLDDERFETGVHATVT